MKNRLVCLVLAMALLLGLIPSASAGASLDFWAQSSFDKEYDVYSGPGTFYYRANNGRASYGYGAVRVYGVVGEWTMIGYQLSSGDYRIGYISSDCLSHTKYVTGNINYNLQFDDTVAYADDYCRITDDPVINNKMIYQIPEGTAVRVLATLGTDWTYIEALTSYGYMRGFVWSIHLRSSGTAPTMVPPPTGRPYTPPTAAPYVPPTAAPYIPPTTAPYVPTWAPYVPTYPPYVPPTATPVASIPNTYYHDTSKGEWLPSYQRVTFTSSWPVYSGPGEYYYRAAEGRALMGGGSCIVYGVENGWALIGYGLSNGNFRIGYINAAALPQIGLHIAYLDLSYTTRQLTYSANLTDDIMRYKPTVATLPAGTYVLFLGYVYDSNTTWAYVEVLAQNSIMRGFIPATAL